MARKSKCLRRGSANRTILVLISSLVALGVLVASVVDRRPRADGISKKENQEPLVVYCAVSNKGVLEAIRADYEKEFGRPCRFSTELRRHASAALQVAGGGDLYLPGDDSYLKLASEHKLLAEEFPLATMNVVVGVAKGNPKKIERLADLLREDVRLAQANPDAAAVGKLTRERCRPAAIGRS